MNARFRAAFVIVGAVVFCATVGKGLDTAGVTPDYDGDMFTLGVFAGLGLAVILLGFVRDP